MSFSRRPELVALAIVGGLAIIVALMLGAACRPLPALAVAPVQRPLRGVTGSPPPWPSQGSAALGVLDGGIVSTSNDGQAVPLASVTKVMTALVALDGHPLKAGEAGPTITVTHDDVAEFLREAGQDESVVGVEEGENLTELQLLQGLLIPSGNNYAYIIARWDAGGLPAFVQKMNAKAAALGMTQTKYADASGISSANVGTAADQVRAGIAAMRSPVFAAVVATKDTTLPFAGAVHTTNSLLGTHGVIGLKTGNTDEAGGCLLFAANKQFGDRQAVVVGAVLKQPALENAFTAAATLVDGAGNVIQPLEVLSPSMSVATATAPWGANTPLVPKDSVTLLAWPGATLHVTPDVPALHAPIPAGTDVGTATVEVGDQRVKVDLLTQRAVPKAGFFWRVFRH